MRRPVFWILLFALASSVFGWETYNAWTADTPHADPPAAGFAMSPIPDGFADNAERASDLGLQVAAIAARPLFRADRQPFTETTAVVAQRNYEAELARYSLIGIVLLEETMKGIVVGTTAGARVRWEVALGDSLPGFTVKEFQEDALLLAADGKDFLLRMYAGGPKGQFDSFRTEIPVAPAPGQAQGPLTPSPTAPQLTDTPPGMPSPVAQALLPPAASPFGLRGTRRPPLRIPAGR